MRINVYAEELTRDVEIVTKTPENVPDVTFFAVRVYLKSPDALHHTADDDDRSAITVWVPWTRSGGHDWQTVAHLFDSMANKLRDFATRVALPS